MMTRIACVVLLVAGAAACKSKPASTGPKGTSVALEWKATEGEGENVKVTLVVGGEAVELGTLNAATDTADRPGSPADCSVHDATATAVEFHCGATPAYNYFRAELVDKELVITHVHGVDESQEPGAKPAIKEVKRMPVVGGALTVAPYVAPATPPPAT